MNKNQYRTIFNARRGMRMAVAETAASQSKSASGEGCSASMGHGAASAGRTVFTLAAGASLILLSGLLAPPVDAQIVADRNAPGNQRPTLLQTANGLPQVNIQTPSAAGVSRNTYSQFDVQAKGAILNNSRTDVNTQLGGYVQGNPWLATGSARVILNEVNSSSASQLRGFVEVAGPRAEVILANPAGIAVNGGGFLNASAVTLTTGTPVLKSGSLDSFQVRGGSVTVIGAGLDSSTADFTNILARAVQVNAGIWAKDLKVVTGANDISAVSAATPSATASSSGAGATAAFALDVSALGGMYAGKIMLVGTEAGLGVRNGGLIGATAGDVVLSNNGWLSNSGVIYASGDTAVSAQGSIANMGKGVIAAQNNTRLNAQGANGSASSEAASTIAAGMDGSGMVGTTGALNVTAATAATLHGQIASGADTAITATSLDISGATVAAQNAVLAASEQGINASGAHVALRGTLTAQAQTALVTNGATVNAAHINLAAHDLANVNGKLQQSGVGDMAIHLPGNLDNTGGVIATNATHLDLTAATLTNAAGGSVLHAGDGALAVNAGTFSGNGGTMASNGALIVHASGTVDLQNASTSAQQVSIHAASLGNQGGRIVQANSALAAAHIAVTGALDNTGGFIGSNAALQINAGSVTNTGGEITSLQRLGVASNGVIGNRTGLIAGTGNVSISGMSGASSAATMLDNSAGLVQSGATLTVNADQIANAATYTAPASNTSALGLVGKDVQLTANKLNNQGGEVLASNKLTVLAVQGIDNGAGQLLSQGDLSLDASGDFNNAGTVHANGNTSISSGGAINNSGTIAGRQLVQISANSINNTVGSISAQGVSLKAVQDINNTGGAISADNKLLLQAGRDINVTSSTQTSSSFLGLNLDNKTSSDSQAHSSAIATRLVSTQKVEIGIGNQAELQGTEIEASQIAFTQTDPRKAGVLILGASTNTKEASHTEKNETLGLYQEAKGSGSKVETLNQTSLKGNVTFDAGLKITAQVPKDVQATAGGQALAAQVQTLQGTLGASQTGLEYLNQLANNPNVKWDQVAQANEHWSYDQAGLTPAGAALLSIAVAAYTGGLGAELLGGTAATAATATTVATSATLVGSTAFATAVNAGFASLAAQASVAMVNNGGDIGKTLSQLGSEQSIKGLLTTMVTAGALDKLGSSGMFNGQSGAGASGVNGIGTAQTAATFGDKLLKNITNNVAGAAIDSAINGKALDEKALSSALSSALITTGLASGANAIGDAKMDSFTSNVAHAVLGCAGGAALAGNSGGCGAVAVGAAIGEMAANYALNNGMSDTQAAALAKVLSATAGLLAGGGGNNVAAVNIATATGANAADNNRILHKTETQKAAQLATQSDGKYTRAQIEDAIRNSRNAQFNEDINSNTQIPNTDTRKPMDPGAQFQLAGC
jgi:filamentous hemagglutinin